ncbi:tyrosine-protein phosphatase [Microbacterium marinilacus]|uniref:Tyrosine-protein phosphatase n=1 Tax=Microbacterium marinilacus TaxID=415209 RepID=A0ABP7BFM5_9MICO|nr:tyrosine-protein phosphatase [Microbacterium marinilacus]MBY0689533.1 tyrosine-protein phosphatase [Microbacterium marinilacus]
MRHDLLIEGLANVRDLGGLKRSDGSVTPRGVFVRAEALDRLTPAGWDRLSAHGVRTVLDLRRPHERTGAVPAGIARVCLDLDGDDEAFWSPLEADGRWGTPLYYLAHLRELPDRLAAVLDAIASAPEGAVLFHCGAGWDRTGLLAAVLLRALDVTEDDAASDYLASFANAAAMTAVHNRSFDAEERLEVLARFGHTADSAFRAAYRDLDLDEWFDLADVAPKTRLAVTTWRGSTDRA